MKTVKNEPFKSRIQIILLLVILLTAIGGKGFAQEAGDEAAPESGTRVRDGINFAVPEDWPIEKRGGAVGPVPIEEYLKIKFDKVTGEIESLKKRVTVLEDKAEEKAASKQSTSRLFRSEQVEPSEGGAA